MFVPSLLLYIMTTISAACTAGHQSLATTARAAGSLAQVFRMWLPFSFQRSQAHVQCTCEQAALRLLLLGYVGVTLFQLQVAPTCGCNLEIYVPNHCSLLHSCAKSAPFGPSDLF
eukprot:SM005435S18179  [mRNA]  locus=s5435:19:382:- [translate_table: standard]